MNAQLTRVAERTATEVRALMARRSRGRDRHCPLCGWTGTRFLSFGHGAKRRDDALCPRCRSVERQRLAHSLLDVRLPSEGRTLHIAPERAVAAWLRARSSFYLSGDLDPTRAMRELDLTWLDLPDGSFDVLYCSHVLEHIPDDRSAMREMRRVLAPGGLAVVMVPIGPSITDEDPACTDPSDRARRFGQSDHVRFYGLDVVDRLTGVGFAVEVLSSDDLSDAEVARCRLVYPTTRHVLVCR